MTDKINTSKSELQKIIQETIDTKIGEFYVDRETHWKHHQSLESFMKWSEKTRGTISSIIVKSIITGIMVIIGLGILHWLKKT